MCSPPPPPLPAARVSFLHVWGRVRKLFRYPPPLLAPAGAGIGRWLGYYWVLPHHCSTGGYPYVAPRSRPQHPKHPQRPPGPPRPARPGAQPRSPPRGYSITQPGGRMGCCFIQNAHARPCSAEISREARGGNKIARVDRGRNGAVGSHGKAVSPASGGFKLRSEPPDPPRGHQRHHTTPKHPGRLCSCRACRCCQCCSRHTVQQASSKALPPSSPLPKWMN